MKKLEGRAPQFVCTLLVLSITFPVQFYHFLFLPLASLVSITLSHSPHIKVSLSKWGIFSCASQTLPTLVLFLSFPPPPPLPLVRQDE